MSVSLYFGLPGCGKTTLMTKLAIDAIKSGRYLNVYGNVPLKVFGYTFIDNDCIGKYGLENCLILIDEATLFADNRDYKGFTKDKITYFLEHRHFNTDICLFTQQWDGVDRKIRVITDRCYYVYKGLILGKWWTRYYRIPYGIIIPDPKKGADKLGEIVQGYARPNFFIRLLSPWVYRPKYYPYYDSWIRPAGFPPLPSKYTPYVEVSSTGELLKTEEQKKASSRYLRTLQRRKKLRSIVDRIVSPVRTFFSSVREMHPSDD